MWPRQIGGRIVSSPAAPPSSTHKEKERLVAFDAKLGPKDVISVVSDAQYSNVMLSTYNQCQRTTDARDIDWPFCDMIGYLDLGPRNIQQTPFPRDE